MVVTTRSRVLWHAIVWSLKALLRPASAGDTRLAPGGAARIWPHDIFVG